MWYKKQKIKEPFKKGAYRAVNTENKFLRTGDDIT